MKLEDDPYLNALKEADSSDPDESKILRLLDIAAAKGDSRAIFARASCYEDGKYGSKIDKKLANKLFFSLRNSRIPEAIFAIAYCYDTGEHVKLNKNKAFEYYLIASMLGYGPAAEQISEFFREGRDVFYSPYLARFFRSRKLCDEAEVSPPDRVWLRPRMKNS